MWRRGDVTLEGITEYLAHCKRRGLSTSSIKLVVVAIKIFFRFLLARDFLKGDPAEYIPLPARGAFPAGDAQ